MSLQVLLPDHHTDRDSLYPVPWLQANQQAVNSLTYDEKKDPSSIIHYWVEFGNVLLLHGPLGRWLKVFNQR